MGDGRGAENDRGGKGERGAGSHRLSDGREPRAVDTTLRRRHSTVVRERHVGWKTSRGAMARNSSFLAVAAERGGGGGASQRRVGGGDGKHMYCTNQGGRARVMEVVVYCLTYD